MTLVTPHRTEARLWKALALGFLVFCILVPAVSPLVGPEGKSWARVTLVFVFCAGRKERVTLLMEVAEKLREPAPCPLLH